MPVDKSALLEAIDNDDLDYLKQNQANFDVTLSLDNEGNTALHRALIDKKPNITRWLVSNNLFDPNIVNQAGLNVFECALRRDNLTFAAQLFENKAKPQKIDLDNLTPPEDKEGKQLASAIVVMAFYGIITPNSKIKVNNRPLPLTSYLKKHNPLGDQNLQLGSAAFQLKDWVNQINTEQAVTATPDALKQIIRSFKLVEPIKDLNTIFIWLHDYHQQQKTEQLDKKLTMLQNHVYQYIYKQQRAGWRWRIAFTVIAGILLTPLSLFFTIPLMLKPYREQMLRKEANIAPSNRAALAKIKDLLKTGLTDLVDVELKDKPEDELKDKPKNFFKDEQLLRKACYHGYKIMTPQQAVKYRLVKTALSYAITTGVIPSDTIRYRLADEYQAAKLNQ